MNIFTHTLQTQNNCKLASPPSFSLPSHKTVIISQQFVSTRHKTWHHFHALPCLVIDYLIRSLLRHFHFHVSPASLDFVGTQLSSSVDYYHSICKTIIEKQVNIAYTSLLRPHRILLPQTAAAMLPLNTISSHPAGRAATRSDCRLS